MFRTRIGRGFTVGVLGLSAAVWASGGASASVTAAPVLSDVIQVTGNATPGSSAGTYNFQSTKCKLTSDAESTPFPCKMTAVFNVSSSGSTTGNATVTSGDGTTKWKFTTTPGTSSGSFTMKGNGKEADKADPGTTPPPPYPVQIKGKGTFTPSGPGFVVTGKIKVFESSTAP